MLFHARGIGRAFTLALAATAVVLMVSAAPARADGGINSGQPGSVCVPKVSTATSTPTDVNTKAFGANAPAYYEIAQPTGIFAGKQPKGVVLLVHGGAWYGVGSGQVAGMRSEANRWRDRGWSTINIDYRGCANSLDDVLWFYDASRVLVGSRPMCVEGQSAGGQLALMLAVERPSVACVVSQAGPTDFISLPTQPAYDPATGGVQMAGPTWAAGMAAAAFGPTALVPESPALATLHAPVLAANSAHDNLVPYAQSLELADHVRATDAAAYIDTMELAAGPQGFVHQGVSRTALETYWQHELQLIAPIVGTTPSVAVPVRLPQSGNAPSGSAQLNATVQAASVSVTAGSTPIALAAGPTYQLQTCVGWYGTGKTVQQCSPVKTVTATSATSVAAPAVSASFTRSTTQSNFAMVNVTATYQDAAGTHTFATSWPDTGLAGAGLTFSPA